MCLRSWLAAGLVLLMLAGCAELVPGTGQTPYSSDRTGEYPRDRGGDGGGGGGM